MKSNNKNIAVSRINLDTLVKLQKAGYQVSVKQVTLQPANSQLTYCYEQDIKAYKNKYRYEVAPQDDGGTPEVCRVPHIKKGK